MRMWWSLLVVVVDDVDVSVAVEVDVRAGAEDDDMDLAKLGIDLVKYFMEVMLGYWCMYDP